MVIKEVKIASDVAYVFINGQKKEVKE